MAWVKKSLDGDGGDGGAGDPPKLPVLEQDVSRGAYRVPKGHTPVAFVPLIRGARCTSCKWVSDDLKECLQEDYRRFMGTKLLPGPAHLICSDWWEGK